MPAPQQQPKRARCVVWHPERNPPRPDLAAALNRPAFRVFRATNPYHALATICSWNESTRPLNGEGTLLLLVEPEELTGLAPFLDARDLYAADAVVWVYERAATPTLRIAQKADFARWKALTQAPTAAPEAPIRPSAAGTAPALRLSGEGVLPPERTADQAEPETPSPVPDVKPRVPGPPPEPSVSPVADGFYTQPAPPARPAPASLLTDDELAMLLAIDPANRTK